MYTAITLKTYTRAQRPTQVECAQGALNQLPPWTTISGDIRLTPFYDAGEVYETVSGWVKELNETQFAALPTRGPCSKYTLDLPDCDIKQGTLELTWAGSMEEVRQMEGIACHLDSPGLKALTDATADVKGVGKPYAITGSLPLVRQLQSEGFDVQIVGYGNSATYHADNEYASLQDMKDAYQILLRVICTLDK